MKKNESFNDEVNEPLLAPKNNPIEETKVEKPTDKNEDGRG